MVTVATKKCGGCRLEALLDFGLTAKEKTRWRAEAQAEATRGGCRTCLIRRWRLRDAAAGWSADVWCM